MEVKLDIQTNQSDLGVGEGERDAELEMVAHCQK